MLDQLEFLNDIGRQDERIAREVERAKVAMHETPQRDAQDAQAGRRDDARGRGPHAEQRAVRDRLAWSQRELATARATSRRRSTETAASEASEYLHEVEGLAGAERRARRADPGGAGRRRPPRRVSTPVRPLAVARTASSGPCTASVTSGFGWRWGRMHEGIDIAVGSGTPVVAAASGTVIFAGWMGGYGNLVVVDHGNGIATAYGHNTPSPSASARRRAGPADRLLREHRPLDRPARALRGAGQRRRRRPARLPLGAL